MNGFIRLKRNETLEPRPVLRLDAKEDFFEPTDEYTHLIICRHCSRTDGLTETNEICKYCKNNWANQVTTTTSEV